MQTPNQTGYSKLTDHRGNKRLWLEGLRLAKNGFTKGEKYTAEFNKATASTPASIVLRLDEAGDRIVSGRRRKGQEHYTPIIDICCPEVEQTVGSATRIRADFYQGVIEVTIHHEDKAKEDRETRTAENVQAGKVTEGALCAGAGVASAALHEGLKLGGLESSVEWIVDRESKYLQVAIDNNPAITDDTRIFQASLEELEPELLGPVDILQVSLPCTGHSKAGKSKNAISQAEQHSTDATAAWGLMAAIRAVNPSIIVSENVTEAEDSGTYLMIKAELVRRGYNIHSRVLDETDAGTLEKRKRWWFVAVSAGLDFIDLNWLQPLRRVHNKLGEVLEQVPADSKTWADNQYLKDKAIKDKAAGKGFARQLVTADSKAVGTIGRHYNKRRSTEPFVLRADGKERLLTPAEHARVKGIDPAMVEGVNATTAHEALGQSILWGHAQIIGQHIADRLRDAFTTEQTMYYA